MIHPIRWSRRTHVRSSAGRPRGVQGRQQGVDALEVTRRELLPHAPAFVQVVADGEGVGRLPGAQRDAIVLCELDGLSIREAAEVLGWKESRVKVTLFRARRRLREFLKDYVADGTVRRTADRNR